MRSLATAIASLLTASTASNAPGPETRVDPLLQKLPARRRGAILCALFTLILWTRYGDDSGTPYWVQRAYEMPIWLDS